MGDINLRILGEEGVRVQIAGITNFVGLTDTPTTYSGQTGKTLTVNSSEDGLEFSEAGGSAEWGQITGTLSDQTDLQNSLNLKYDAADFDADFDAQFATKDTDDLTEGSTNLYDQEVSISGGTNVTIGGTYPTFTLTDNSASEIDLNSHTTDGTIHFTEGSIDHTAIQNIGTNTHAQIDTHISSTSNPHEVSFEQARTKDNQLSGNIDMNSNKIVSLDTPVDGSDAVTKDYVDSLAQGLNWQDKVSSQVNFVTSEPAGPTLGDRYINTTTGTSSGTSQSVTANYIYEWDGSSWEETIVSEGFACWVEDEDVVYVFNISWVKFGTTVTHNNTIGKQGGTTDEYFHLTSSQNTSVGNIVTAGHAEDMDQDVAKDTAPIFQGLEFDTSPTGVADQEGAVKWNSTEKTLDINSGLGPVLQTGYEDWILVYNDTGGELCNGCVVYPVGQVGGVASVALANASTHKKISTGIAVMTMTIQDGETGIATQRGDVRGFDTDHLVAGQPVYVGLTDGTLTSTRPEFPDYAILVGGTTISDSTNGAISVQQEGQFTDTIVNFWNGVFRETFDFRISSNGTVVTGSLEPSNGHDDMTMMFSDGFTMLDTNPAATIALTPGTDINPQTNYIYIPQLTKILTVSTSDWPTAEHIKVAEVVVQSAATTEIDGALRNQNWNDAIENTSTYQGHLSHICEKLRQFEAQWDSGTEGSAVVAGAGSEVYIKNTAGIVYQMHKQNFPIIDMTPYTIDAVSQGSKTFTISDDGDLSSTFPDARLISVKGSTGNDGLYTIVSINYSAPDFVITVSEAIPSAVVDGEIGDDINVVNDSVTAYDSVDNLVDITLDASGNSFTNTSFSIVVWGVVNKNGEASHLMANLPTDTYNKNFPDTAVSDASNYSVYEIPKQFQGVGFLIARFTFVDNGGVWSLYDTEDLRGRIPNSTAGGGGGGTGVTTFLGLTDTPSAYTGQAGKVASVNVGESALEFTEISNNVEDGTAAGQMVFWDGSSEYKHTEVSEIFYDDTNKRLGIGESSPQKKLHITSSGEDQLRLAYDGSVYADFSLESGGDLAITPTGGQIKMEVDADDVVRFSIENNDTGTSAAAAFFAEAGSAQTYFGATGVNYSLGTGTHFAAKSFIADLTGQGLTFLSNGGDIEFYTGPLSTNNALTIDTSQVATFVNFPITPSSAPTTNYQTANKKYVDDFTGSSNIVTLGTIGTGTWNGTALGANYVPNHDDLNGFVANEHIDWTSTSENLDTTGTIEGSEVREVSTETAGESVVNGDLCYLKSDGKYWKVDADAEATSKGRLAIAQATISADATGLFLFKGKQTTTGLTAADELFVSTTAGEWTNTKPSATGDIVRLVAYALSTTVLYFDPDKTYVEVA